MQRTQAVTPTRSARAAAREGSSAGFKESVVDITNLRRWDHVAAATPSRPLQDHIASRIRLRRGSSAHVRQSSMLASQHDGQLAALLGRGGDQGVVGDERHVDLIRSATGALTDVVRTQSIGGMPSEVDPTDGWEHGWTTREPAKRPPRIVRQRSGVGPSPVLATRPRRRPSGLPRAGQCPGGRRPPRSNRVQRRGRPRPARSTER
jgi:hypothetical protein